MGVQASSSCLKLTGKELDEMSGVTCSETPLSTGLTEVCRLQRIFEIMLQCECPFSTQLASEF